jgi:hypothetical protein
MELTGTLLLIKHARQFLTARLVRTPTWPRDIRIQPYSLRREVLQAPRMVREG